MVSEGYSTNPLEEAPGLDPGAVHSCRNAMSAQGLTSDDLVGGVETVPSGVGGVANLEADGYRYIKIP